MPLDLPRLPFNWSCTESCRHLARLSPAGSCGGAGGSSGPPAICLDEWLPWQTTLQPTHGVSHSGVSRNLVRLLAFMAELAHTGADAYDQEMTDIRRHGGVETGEQ